MGILESCCSSRNRNFLNNNENEYAEVYNFSLFKYYKASNNNEIKTKNKRIISNENLNLNNLKKRKYQDQNKKLNINTESNR